jgi:TPR repeat protein
MARGITALTLALACTAAMAADDSFEAVSERAKNGEAEAQYELGRRYDYGEGVTVDDAAAVR